MNLGYKIVYFLLGSIILLLPALFNNFPLIYSDTGTYIYSGFENIVPPDRPIFYGFFLRHISLSETLWLVVAAQALIGFWLIHTLFKTFYSLTINAMLICLFLVLILNFTTGLGSYVVQVTPDIFTAYLFIAFICLLVSNMLTLGDKIGLWLIIYASLLFHLSNVLTFFVLLSFIAMYHLLFRNRRTFLINDLTRKIIISFGVLILSWATHSYVNYSNNFGFVMSPSSHVFLIARLNETGMLYDVLSDEEEEGRVYQLTSYKGELKNYPLAQNFIWDPNSPLYKTNGWADTSGEYQALIKIALFSPRYLGRNIHDSFVGTVKQFSSIAAGHGIGEYSETTAPYINLRDYLKKDLERFLLSSQQNGKLDFRMINCLQEIWFYLAAIFLIVILLFKNVSFNDARLRSVLVLILIATISNAFICGTFVNTVDRLQGRVFWLIPLVILLALLGQLIKRIPVRNKNN